MSARSTPSATAAACVECGGCLADAAPSAAAAWAAAAGATSAATAFASLRDTTLRARLMRLAGGTSSPNPTTGNSPTECAPASTFFPAIPHSTAAAAVPPTPVPDADIGTVAFAPCGHLAHWSCAAFIESLCSTINPNVAPTCPACGAAINDVVCVLAEFAPTAAASDGVAPPPLLPTAIRAHVGDGASVANQGLSALAAAEDTDGSAREFVGASWPLRLAALQGHVASVQQRQAAARATVMDLQHACALALVQLENLRRSAQHRAPRMVALPVQGGTITAGAAGAGAGTPDVDAVAQRLFRRVVDSAPDPALPLGAVGSSTVSELRSTIVNALESERLERQRILDLGSTLSTTRGAVREAWKRAAGLQKDLRRLQKEDRAAARLATASTVARVAAAAPAAAGPHDGLAAPAAAARPSSQQTLPLPAPGSNAAAFVDAVMASNAYQPMASLPVPAPAPVGPTFFSSRPAAPAATSLLAGASNGRGVVRAPAPAVASRVDADGDDDVVVWSSTRSTSGTSRRAQPEDVVVVGATRRGRRGAVDVDVDAPNVSGHGASDDDVLVISDEDDGGPGAAGSRRPRSLSVATPPQAQQMGAVGGATGGAVGALRSSGTATSSVLGAGSGSGSGIFGRLSPNDVYALPLPTTVQTDIRNSRRVA